MAAGEPGAVIYLLNNDKKMDSIRNIIFDFGGVIFEIEHERTARAFEELGLPQIRNAFSHAVQAELFRDFETGKISPEIFREGIRKMSDSPLDDGQIDNAWNAMLLGLPAGNISLLRQLKEKYRTFLLSNTNAIHYAAFKRAIREHWNTEIGDCFEQAYFSHLIHLRKPDAEAYRYVMDKHGLNPKETVFIDDTPINIEAAAAVGMQTLFTERNTPLRQVVERFL